MAIPQLAELTLGVGMAEKPKQKLLLSAKKHCEATVSLFPSPLRTRLRRAR